MSTTTAALPLVVVQFPADNALPARLIHPCADVASGLRVAVEKGAEIRARRIRYQEDLDEARLAKLKWTQAMTDLLIALFDNTSVADYCNDWVGKIFPEYAEFGNFVEQFYEEMEYRLAKLRSVLERVEQMDGSAVHPILTEAPYDAPNPGQARSAATSSAAAPVAPVTPVAPRIAAVESMRPAVQTVPKSHVTVFGAPAADAAYVAVAALLERLNVGAHPATDPLAAGATDAAVFVVPSQPTDGAATRVAAFQLGCAVGRMGASRVCVLHPAGAPLCPESAVAHIPADAGGGWQLQLARHLKQAGLNVDLNKLC